MHLIYVSNLQWDDVYLRHLMKCEEHNMFNYRALTALSIIIQVEYCHWKLTNCSENLSPRPTRRQFRSE